MHNFKLQFSHVGGCGGQPIRSKSILKVKTQIPIPKEHAQITFLNPIDCFLSQITIYNFPICLGSPCILNFGVNFSNEILAQFKISDKIVPLKIS